MICFDLGGGGGKDRSRRLIAKHYAVDAELDLQDVVSQALTAFLTSKRAGR